MLAAAQRSLASRWLGAALGVFFIVAIFLTGRRKFLLEIMMFLPVLLILLAHFRIGGRRMVRVVSLLALGGAGIAVFGMLTDDTITRLGEASLRGEGSVVDATLGRFYNLTFGAFEYVIEANGIFGAGAGSGSQGAQHFGGGAESVGLAAEGGAGKVLAELGVPGLLAFIWIAVATVAAMWASLDETRKRDAQSALLTAGLVAFLASNAVVFVSAHQAFGDLFVLLLIGWAVGFVLASRRWSTNAVRDSFHGTAAPATGYVSARNLR
jgi:O-antigen ligase